MHLLGLIGATIIFTWSTLFEKVRAIYPKFLRCSMCVGFWVGCLGIFLDGKPHEVYEAFLNGTTVSLLSFTTYLILTRLQKE